MRIDRFKNGYHLWLDYDEAIELMAEIARNLPTLKTRRKNFSEQLKGSKGDWYVKQKIEEHKRDGLAVKSYSAKDPERNVMISISDLPLELEDTHDVDND